MLCLWSVMRLTATTETEMATKINYNGRSYHATVIDWTDGTSTASIRIGRHSVLLRVVDRDYNGPIWGR
jgi:hypothetical protein